MMPVRLKPVAPRSRVKYFTTEPLRSHNNGMLIKNCKVFLLQNMCFMTANSVASDEMHSAYAPFVCVCVQGGGGGGVG